MAAGHAALCFMDMHVELVLQLRFLNAEVDAYTVVQHLRLVHIEAMPACPLAKWHAVYVS